MASEHPHPHDRQAEGTDVAVVDARTPAVLAPGHTFQSVTDAISHVGLTKRTPIGWFIGFGIGFLFLMLLNVTIGHLLMTGIGIWGNNVPVIRRWPIVTLSSIRNMKPMPKPRNQPIGVRFDRTTWLIESVTDSKVCPGAMTSGVRASSVAVSVPVPLSDISGLPHRRRPPPARVRYWDS